MKPKFKTGDEVYYISLLDNYKIKKAKITAVNTIYELEGEPMEIGETFLFKDKIDLLKYLNSEL